MPSTEIRSYRVGVLYREAGDFSRFLALQPAPDVTGPGSGGIWLYFSGTGPCSGSERSQMIVAKLPEALFGDMYHVLQTESPAFFVWQTGDGGAIASCGITTSQEPAGEGWPDRSL